MMNAQEQPHMPYAFRRSRTSSRRASWSAVRLKLKVCDKFDVSRSITSREPRYRAALFSMAFAFRLHGACSPKDMSICKRKPFSVGHPDYGLADLMEDDRMPDLEQASPSAALRPTKDAHLGAGARAAERRKQGEHALLAKAVTGFSRVGVGGIIDGCQETVRGIAEHREIGEDYQYSQGPQPQRMFPSPALPSELPLYCNGAAVLRQKMVFGGTT